MQPAEMGAKLSEHRGKFLAGGWLWYVGGILLLAAGFNVFNGVREVLAGEATVIEVISITLVSGLLGVLLLTQPVLRWRQRVVCYEQGIVWHRLYGDKIVRRDEITDVQLVFHRGRYGSFDEVQLRTKDGAVVIKGIANIEQLANHAKAWLSGRGAPGATPAGWTPPAEGGGAAPPADPSEGGWEPPEQGGGGWTPPNG